MNRWMMAFGTLGLTGMLLAFASGSGAKPASTPPPQPPQKVMIPMQSTALGWQAYQTHTYGIAPENRVLLHLPDRKRDTPYRLVVLVHGGNFLGGSPEDASMATLARFFEKRGFAVASVGYRTLIDHRWPVPVTDVQQGVDYVRDAMGRDRIADVTLVGYSAGAVSGALLLYSEQFPTLKGVDQFIGISGLYDPQAAAAEPLEAIRQHSLERFDILDRVDAIERPKQVVPALLIQGSRDTFADHFPGSPRSHAARLARVLNAHRVPVDVLWIDQPGYSDHSGPVDLFSHEPAALGRTLDAFLGD